MNHSFTGSHFLLKKQAIALTGIFRIYDDSDRLVAYSKQKMFKLREDIRVYSDEAQSQEIMVIKARQILDFSAAYDVFDSRSQALIGTLRRKGLRSMVIDSWEILLPNGQVVGTITEDNVTLALLRRFLLGSLLPQSYDVEINGQHVMDLSQRFSLFRYQLDINFLTQSSLLDPRLGIAAGILLGAIEGRQSD